MIQIHYQQDGSVCRLELQGHADYAASGEDIVCAGVSSIIFSLLGWLENHPEEMENADTDVSSGAVFIYCDCSEKALTAFELVAIGLEQIALRYPDHVAIELAGI